ncbi:MAG: gamma-glutamylcyclotransferase [Alphaproteobacteria bacterium]|nr:gamma-glutamylcyclotransferase [Alphaproteobacteria bacterium]
MRQQVSDDPQSIERIRREWGGVGDLWVFGYASLIWRPDIAVAERRLATVRGWHRALKMWSRINRGTPERPGLVFALLNGGSCQGVTMRVPKNEVPAALQSLWAREMPSKVYLPRWLNCATPEGTVRALTFILPRSHPNYTGPLSDDQYRTIFADRVGGRYGHTLEYAQSTLASLREWGIRDLALERLLSLAD